MAALIPEMPGSPTYVFIDKNGWSSITSWLSFFRSVKIANHKPKNHFVKLWCYFACSSACRCFYDALITGSSSKFMPRTADYKLQLQLEAFRFQGLTSGMVSKTDLIVLLHIKCSKNHLMIFQTLWFLQISLTCHLRASSAAHAIDSNNRACSYINGWVCVCVCVLMKKCDWKIDKVCYWLHPPFFAGGKRPVELIQVVPPVTQEFLIQVAQVV